MNINRTIIVTASNAPLARTLAASLSAGGVGMFEVPRYTNGVLTHYISSGQIDAAFDAMLPKHELVTTTDVDGNVTTTMQPPSQAIKDAAAQAMVAAAGGMATLAQCQDLIDTSIVVDCDVEAAETTCARLGLLSVS